MIDADFDVRLDEYQARLQEEADEAADRSWETAARPGAEPVATTFDDLRAGDYMTADGRRWVEVVEVRGPYSHVKRRAQAIADDELEVTFEIPEPVTVSGETRYVLTRRRAEAVTVDGAAR